MKISSKPRTKLLSVLLSTVVAVGSLMPLAQLTKVHAATNQVFRLEAIEDLTGEAITGGYISLQARTKGEQNEEDWFTIHMFKLNGKLQRYTFEQDDSKYEFRYKAEQLPLGYKVENAILPLTQTKQATFNVLRDTEAVEAAVAKATYDLQIHTVPPVAGAKFYLEEIPKPENLATVHSQKPYNPTYDLGSIFASWRKREEMISVAQPVHTLSYVGREYESSNKFPSGAYPHARLEVDQSFSVANGQIWTASKDELSRYSVTGYGGISKDTSKLITTLANGTSKIQNIPYAKWYRLIRLASELDQSLVLYESKDTNHTFNSSVDADDSENYKTAYKFKSNFIGTKQEYAEADWIVVKGPRSVNTSKTKYVYDVYIKTADDANLEEVIKEDTLKAYEGLLVDVDSVTTDDIDAVRMALADLSTDAALYREEIAKLKDLLTRLEKELAEERAVAQVNKAQDLVNKAKETRATEDIEKAKIAVNGLPDGEEKTRLLEELEALKRPQTYEISYRFVGENGIELSEAVTEQIPETENLANGSTPTLQSNFNRIPATVNGKQGAFVFSGWDKTASQVQNAAQSYVGTWRFEENPPNANEVAEQKATEFRNEFSDVLNKTVENVKESDRTKIEEALAKYNSLSSEVKIKLETEKQKLDSLISRLDREKTNPTEAPQLPKGIVLGQWYPDSIVKVPSKLSYYDGETIKLEGLVMKYVRYELKDGQYTKHTFEVPYEDIQALAKGWKLLNRTPIAKLSEAVNGKLKIRLTFELEDAAKSKE